VISTVTSLFLFLSSDHPSFPRIVSWRTNIADELSIDISFDHGTSVKVLPENHDLKLFPRKCMVLYAVGRALERLHSLDLAHGLFSLGNVVYAQFQDREWWWLLPAFWTVSQPLAEAVAPELANGTRPTPASDIWCFGALMKHLLKGIHFELFKPVIEAMLSKDLTKRPRIDAFLSLFDPVSGAKDVDDALRVSPGVWLFWQYRAMFDVLSAPVPPEVASRLRGLGALRGELLRMTDMAQVLRRAAEFFDGGFGRLVERPLSSETSSTAELPIFTSLIMNLDEYGLDRAEIIGQGGFARVMKVQRKDSAGPNQPDYALKEQHPACVLSRSDPTDRKQLSPAQVAPRFFGVMREVLLQFAARHPAILTLQLWNVKWDDTDPTIYTLSDFMVGGPLVFSRRGRSTPETLIKKLSPTNQLIVMYGVARGMKFLHSKSIVHRDIRPENIFLDSRKWPKIADLGFAKECFGDDQASALRLTLYIAPEALHSSSYDCRADIYSCGILFYEILARQRASLPSGAHRSETGDVQLVINGLRPDIRLLPNERFHPLINAMWAPDRNHRPPFSEICGWFESGCYWPDGANQREFYEYKGYLDACEMQNARFPPVVRNSWIATLANREDIQLFMQQRDNLFDQLCVFWMNMIGPERAVVLQDRLLASFNQYQMINPTVLKALQIEYIKEESILEEPPSVLLDSLLTAVPNNNEGLSQCDNLLLEGRDDRFRQKICTFFRSVLTPLCALHPGLKEMKGWGLQVKSGRSLQLFFVMDNEPKPLNIAEQREPHQNMILLFGIAQAMDHLHRCGIMHRDLVRSVFVDKKGHPKIGRFELAREDNAVDLTRSVILSGNRPGIWDAPEIRHERGGEDVSYNRSVDVFACGVLFYGILTRQLLPRLRGGSPSELPLDRIPKPWAELLSGMWSEQSDMRPSFHEIVSLIPTQSFCLDGMSEEGKRQFQEYTTHVISNDIGLTRMRNKVLKAGLELVASQDEFGQRYADYDNVDCLADVIITLSGCNPETHKEKMKSFLQESTPRLFKKDVLIQDLPSFPRLRIDSQDPGKGFDIQRTISSASGSSGSAYRARFPGAPMLENVYAKDQWRLETHSSGHGTYGSIKKCTRISEPSKRYVVKIITPCSPSTDSLSENQKLLWCFRELYSLMLFQHPAILRLEGWNVHPYLTHHDETVVAFAMISEFFPGCLGRVVGCRNEKLTPTEKMIILYGIATGMREIHNLGIAHRDLKPDNIFLTSDRRPVICDFGLAKDLSDIVEHSICGTQYYMAPECEDGNYTLAVDVYACAIIFGEIVSGISWSEEVAKSRAARWQRTVRTVRSKMSLEPKLLADLIQEMWSERPEDRPSFACVAERLANPNCWVPGTDERAFYAYKQTVDLPPMTVDPECDLATEVFTKASQVDNFMEPIEAAITDADPVTKCAYFLGAAATSGQLEWGETILSKWKSRAGDPQEFRDDIALERADFVLSVPESPAPPPIDDDSSIGGSFLYREVADEDRSNLLSTGSTNDHIEEESQPI
jgi:serine/threonine protein kinase